MVKIPGVGSVKYSQVLEIRCGWGARFPGDQWPGSTYFVRLRGHREEIPIPRGVWEELDEYLKLWNACLDIEIGKTHI